MLTKYANNPIITAANVPFRVNSIFNPGAVKYKNKYILLCRAEMPIGRSSFVIAESHNGIDFTVQDKPCLTPEDHKTCFEYVEWGIEDARITELEGTFYLTYTGYSKYMPVIILAETKNFKTFKIHGPISEPSNKDAALFPEKIKGFYWKLDRPSAENRRDIWINKSPDLIHWGTPKIVMQPLPGSWLCDKIGSSSTPLKTKDGWLVLFHGVRSLGTAMMYKIGVMLLDLDKPWIVKGFSKDPLIAPDFMHERIGDFGNVTFANGWVREKDGEIKIYYSGSDLNICLATTTEKYLLSLCK